MTSFEVKEFQKWSWPLLSELVKVERIVYKRRLENAGVARFFRRLLSFFSPQSGCFHVLTKEPENDIYVQTGISLIRLFAETDDGIKFVVRFPILIVYLRKRSPHCQL